MRRRPSQRPETQPAAPAQQPAAPAPTADTDRARAEGQVELPSVPAPRAAHRSGSPAAHHAASGRSPPPRVTASPGAEEAIRDTVRRYAAGPRIEKRRGVEACLADAPGRAGRGRAQGVPARAPDRRRHRRYECVGFRDDRHGHIHSPLSLVDRRRPDDWTPTRVPRCRSAAPATNG